ncbi:MAG TPA: hypothetical protein VFF24_05270, partial [Acidimicrobiia bacterium]|nr:hypothetical protein [Acidimicrobiia bacterium]
VGHEKAHAEPRRSEALTRLGDLNVGDAAEVLGGSSAASIDDEGARSSAAIGEIRLGGGSGPAVVLSGLAWRAAAPRSAPAQADFSLGSARIGDEPLSVGTPEQIAGAIDAINAALASQGIHITAPVVTAGAEDGRVDALRIELRDPPLNRAVAGAAYSPLAPVANEAQAAVVEAGGSDPRFSQALLGANLALSVLLGNGGVGVEVGGAMAGLTTREVPDLGSLFGGSEPPPLGGESGELIELPGSTFDDGVTGSDGSGSFGTSDPFDASYPSGGYASLPAGGTDGSVPPAGDGTPPSTPEVALGTDGSRRSQPDQPGRLPAPLAGTVLAAGLAIAGVDWLARRRTVGVVAGLRAAAGLGSVAAGPARSRWSVVTAGVAVMAVLGLTLAPSRVPLSSDGGEEVAAVSPFPQSSGGRGVQTGVPADDGALSGTDSAPGTAAAAAGAADGRGVGSNGPGSATGAAGRAGAGPTANRGNGPGNRAGATGSTVTGPGSRTATSAAGGGGGAVTRGRDCPGGDRQDKNSTYSTPCLRFHGDNGGPTSKGVTGDTITVAMREPEVFDVGTNNQGRITDTAADIKRSVLAFVDYFNRVYQTYGRKVQLVFYKAKTPSLAGSEGGHQEEANADALTVGQEIKAFADVAASAPAYADALARQGVIGYGTFHLSKSWYQARAPYGWAGLPDCTWIAEQSMDYDIKRLGQGPARW